MLFSLFVAKKPGPVSQTARETEGEKELNRLRRDE